MRQSFALLAFALVTTAACSTNPAPTPADMAPGAARPLIHTRSMAIVDSGMAAKGIGRLEIAVRSADRPTQSLPDAEVTLREGDRILVRRIADLNGVVRFDSVAARSYELRVRRIGYKPGVVDVVVTPGCRVDVEIYVGLDFVGIAPIPSTPNRATVTGCGSVRS